MRTLSISGRCPDFDHIDDPRLDVEVFELPPGEASLEFLRPVADRVMELRVFDPRTRDLRVLSTMHSLTSLTVLRCTKPAYEVDLSHLHHLWQFIAPSRPEYFSALSLKALRRLVLNGVKDAHLAEVKAPVEELVLLSSPTLSTLEHGHFDSLTSLEVHLAREFDAASLVQAAPRLRSVEFDTVRSLTGLRELVEHRHLNEIALLNVAQVDDRNFVNHVDDRVKLWVGGRRVPLDPSDLQEVPDAVLARWILHPELERPGRGS